MSSTASSSPTLAAVRVTTNLGGLTEVGSGVLIAPDLVLTATHVVYSPTDGVSPSITVKTVVNGQPAITTGAEVLGYNPITLTDIFDKTFLAWLCYFLLARMTAWPRAGVRMQTRHAA